VAKGGRRAGTVAALAVVSGLAAWIAARPRILAWGTTPEELTRRLPGDDLVADPLYVTTRAITVAAPAASVWPWLVQLGQNRGGFYSYDLFENVARLEVHSADRIHDEWQHLRPGEDYVGLDPDGFMKMTIRIIEPERAFVVRSGAPGEQPQAPGSFVRGELAWSWGFYLEPVNKGTTRLLIRCRAAWKDTAAARLMRPVLLEPVHFLMEERMLRGIRDRAEKVTV
jgi:hypothetical protein